MKEATARVKINKMLETAGWRFFPDLNGPANIQLEPSVALKTGDLDALGENFEKTARGFIDFLLLDARGFPLVVLEAKAEDKDPLIGKEQARKYARSQCCRFVILSNGNLHYFWDLERGNPHIISAFPAPDSVVDYKKTEPNPKRLVDEEVHADYIALTQRPNYAADAAWKNDAERAGYVEANGLRFLRPYQERAVHALQAAVADGRDRFLFEMATGTGKTLLAAAVIKLFLRTGNARRVLFLVDRLELEDQARKNFAAYLAPDYKTAVYKESRDDWRLAEVVVSTVQSFLFNNKYAALFSPTDFDLVISDEAHRSIGGNARAVFDYFVGYKLGLTATPRDYLRGFKDADAKDPREIEHRLMLDTYRTFGCATGQPTFRYSLVDGVRDGYLINPTVVDARTDVTTRLLSEKGFEVSYADEEGVDQITGFDGGDFEKSFFSQQTNEVFCRAFLENALRDPISGEIGKSILFAVSQNHASRLVQILNAMADVMYPGRYQSDFAMQVTSRIPGAQQMAVNFANNRLGGSANVLDGYKTSKARVCVTVGMMTTGYDCPDILNLGLMRPVMSPTEFVQMKGRGTRRHEFTEQLTDRARRAEIGKQPKTAFKLFDFFANCEYFETGFDYDEVLALPKPGKDAGAEKTDTGDWLATLSPDSYTHLGPDRLLQCAEEAVGPDGMRVDRMFFERFEDAVKDDAEIAAMVEAGNWDRVIDYVNREVFDKPEEYYTLDKLRKAADVDRRITLREILEKIFGLIPRFKNKDELLEEEFAKFVADHTPDRPETIPAIKTYFKAYVTSKPVQHIIDTKDFTKLNTNPAFTMRDFKAVPKDFRDIVPEYIKDYVSLNQFMT